MSASGASGDDGRCPSEVWRTQLGALLRVSEAAVQLAISEDRVRELVDKHELLGLASASGETVLPAFQFSGGQPLPELATILKLFAPVSATPLTAATWLTSPDPALNNETPVSWLLDGRSPALAVTAARRYVSILAR